MARYSSRHDSYDWNGWAPYVPVAQRRKNAEKEMAALAKKGQVISPVKTHGRTIAATFWGKAWCDHLEAYSDYSNRLPRGRTYVRNGSVVDLQISAGQVHARVSGSSLYQVKISIEPIHTHRWKKILEECAGKIDSLIELLQGKLSQGVMEVITCKKRGLFPSPDQIEMDCSCPDSAQMCKHIAATLYGVGARLDSQPELLFLLRKADHLELINSADLQTSLSKKTKSVRTSEIATSDLSDIFGIDLDDGSDKGKVEKQDKTVQKPLKKRTQKKRSKRA